MANLRISELSSLAGGDLAADDQLPLSDTSASETKRISAKNLVQFGSALVDDDSIPSAKIN